MDNRSQVMTANLAIMTVKEVAVYLRVSEAKIYRLVKEGTLPVVRIGKAWRFRKDLLDEWLRECSSHEAREARIPNPIAQE
jgi:excisionase family DNA binding protein